MTANVPATSRTATARTGILLLAASLVLVVAGTAEARRPMPQPTPVAPPQQSEEVRFICDVPVDPPRSVLAAYEEFYECIDPEISAWLGQHPEATASLELLYDNWMEARGHDLRDRPEAARWARRHSPDFSSTETELTSRQVSELAPTTQGSTVRVPGAFQRLFVDRASNRLFLTSSTEGLVSIDIAQRYAFELEGRVGSAGATDFFIVDERTAVVEETVDAGGNRDLVVLDISNRSNPREVARLRGVLPQMGGRTTFHSGMAKQPPTFDQYRLLREGRMGTNTCGEPPTVSTHAGVHCRPDGTCYRRETLADPNDGLCERIPPAQRRVAVGRITRRDGGWDVLESPAPMPTGAAPRSAPRSRGAVAESAPVMEMGAAPPARSSRRAETAAAPMEEAFGGAGAADAPAGGAGGAGSLSQMMMVGNTLYVLSADHADPNGWLTTFDLTRPRRPALAHVIRLDNGPEALQRHDNLLLVAGRDALVTASVGITTAPRLLGEYRQDCPVTFDPVVVQGSIAYRTIIVDQWNNACSSRLEVIELSQPHQPVLRTTRAVARPRGLAVLGERLFVANENEGVHVFDITDGVNPAQVGVLPLRGVKDLVLAGFDLYAMTDDRILTYWAGPLFERNVPAAAGFDRVEGFNTVERGDDVRIPEPEGRRRR